MMLPPDCTDSRVRPAVAIASVSAPGKKMPVSAVPVAEMSAGEAAVPAGMVTVPVKTGFATAQDPDASSQAAPDHTYVRPFCVLDWPTVGELGNERGMCSRCNV